MPVIRVDDEIYKWLQSKAVAFEDSPNSVLRRVAGLDLEPKTMSDSEKPDPKRSAMSQRKFRAIRGWDLASREGLDVKNAFYREDGVWYHNATDFPAVYFDRWGYVLFPTKASYTQNPHVTIKKQTHFSPGISALPTYKKMSRPAF
jgi:hypothetical protein